MLPFNRVFDVEVDHSRERLYVSGGPTSDHIVALNADAEIVGSVGGLPGPAGMVLEDGILYAALAQTSAIVQVDTATFEVVGTIDIEPATSPRELIAAGGSFWTVGCDSRRSIYRVDRSSGRAELTLGLNWSSNCPVLLSDPSDDDVFFAFDRDRVGTVRRLRADNGQVEIEVSREAPGGVEQMVDAAVSPDGTQLFVVDWPESDLISLDAATLEQIYEYPTGDLPRSIGITSDGSHVAVGTSADQEPNTFVFPIGRKEPLFSGRRSVNRTYLQRNVFGPANDRLFVFTGPGNDLARVDVLEDVLVAGSELSVSNPRSAEIERSLELGGTLMSSESNEPLGDRVVEGFVRPPRGEEMELGSARTDAEGRFLFEHTPLQLGAYRYRFEWQGDDDNRGAEVTARVDVDKRHPRIGMSVSRSRVRFGRAVELSGHLPEHDEMTNQTISLYRFLNDEVGKDLLEVGEVNEDGQFSIWTIPKRSSWYSAETMGDERYRQYDSGARVLVRPKAVGVMSHHLRKRGRVHVYGTRRYPMFTMRIRPHKIGRKVRVKIQRRTPSGWRLQQALKLQLGRRGQRTIQIDWWNRQPGTLYRVRTIFKGDNHHLPAKTAWRYFKFRR